MKRFICLLLTLGILAGMLAACNGGEASTSEPQAASEAQPVAAESETSKPASQPEAPASQPEPETEGEETPAPDRDLAELYDALAAAAGLEATMAFSKLDLNAGGGVSVDNILEMEAAQSRVGGDSGLVIVLYVANGTADTMVEELEAYRDSLISGPAYEEFADAKAATETARIEAFGNYVVYAAVSVDAAASYDDVDAALAALFG